jgi:hypothetical protein
MLKHLTFAPACFGLFWNHLQGARKQHFAKLLRWDLLIYFRYKIVRFVAGRMSVHSGCMRVICTLLKKKFSIIILEKANHLFRDVFIQLWVLKRRYRYIIRAVCRFRFTHLIRGSLSWRVLNRVAITSKWLLWYYVYKWNDYSHSPTESCC